MSLLGSLHQTCRVRTQLADSTIPALPPKRVRKRRLRCVQLLEDEVSAVTTSRNSNLQIVRSRCAFIVCRRGSERQGVKDWLTPTKHLKNWQQPMLGMCEEQIPFHDLILGRLRRAQTNVSAMIHHPLESQHLSLQKVLRLIFQRRQVLATKPYRTIFDVWCSDPIYAMLWV
jgi:hypothetical protein